MIAPMKATIALLSSIHIIDDDYPFGKSLRRLLNARGFSADYFGSAQSFLDSLRVISEKAKPATDFTNFIDMIL
jgi:FixJ family two-component response regulator